MAAGKFKATAVNMEPDKVCLQFYQQGSVGSKLEAFVTDGSLCQSYEY